MFTKTIAAAAVLVFAVALSAYAPNPEHADAERDTDASHDGDKPNTDTIQLKATQDTAIYYAPNRAIGTLKSGARVRLVGTQGDWAKVRFASERIVVEGWVLKAHLARLTDKDIDPLKGLKNQQGKDGDKDREQNKDKDRD